MAKFSAYTIKPGAGDGDYVLILDPSDTTQALTGTVRRVVGTYYVRTSDGIAVQFTGGGTINLNNKELDVTDDGELDLGGFTLSAAQDVTLASDTLTMGTKTLKVVSSGELELEAHKVTIGATSISIDDVALPIADTNGTINLGGGSLAGDGDGTLTLDGHSLDMKLSVEGTAGESTELAGWTASGKLDGAGLLRGTGVGKLSIQTGATDETMIVTTGGELDLNGNKLDLTTDGRLDMNGFALDVEGADFILKDGGTLDLNGETLVVNSGGTLNINSQVVSFTGTGTLDLGLSRTLAVKDGNITLKGAGNELSLVSDAVLDANGQTIKLPTGEGDAWLSFAGKKLTIDTDASITGGGELALDGFTATVVKTGTVAMTDDLGAAGFWVPLWSSTIEYTSGSSYTTLGIGRWLGTEWGAQTVTFKVGFRITGAGTGSLRVANGDTTTVHYEKVHSSGVSTTFHETFTASMPATDETILWQAKETSNSVFPFYCMFEVT